MSNIQLLVVEDAPIIQKVMTHLFTKLKCDVDIADTGDKALLLSTQKTYQLIFMDLGLPDLDGFEVTSKLRASENYKEVPIIALTAHSEEFLRQRCFEVGMNDFLNKPLTIETASMVIDKFINDIPPQVFKNIYSENIRE